MSSHSPILVRARLGHSVRANSGVFRGCLAAFLLLWAGPALADEPADYILTNAKVYTANPQQPWAEAVAVRGDRIIGVGSDKEVEALAGPETRKADLKGLMVMPGLVESHLHVMLGAVAKSGVWVAEIPTKEGVVEAIGEYARKHPEKKVIFGWGYGSELFGPEGPPKELLDQAVPDRPAYIVREDGHSAWANSKALEMAGIDKDTPDPAPPAGTFGRDAGGNPTGAINGGPANLWTISRLPGAITAESIRAAAGPMMEQVSELGITTVFDAGIPVATQEALDFLAETEKSGGLPFRYFASHYINDPAQAATAIEKLKALDKKYSGGNLQLKTLKITTDGVVENRKAAMIKPYNDGSGSGALNFEPEVISELSVQAAGEGYDIYMHTLGDLAVRVGLDAAEAVREAGFNDTIVTLSHCQIVDPADFPRFAKNKVFINSTGAWMYTYDDQEDILGERGALEYPYRTMMDEGVLFVNSSDFPATPIIDPFTHMEVSMTRRTPGDDPDETRKNPQSAITLDEAIAAYTINGAKMLRMEDEIGSIETGKRADLIVLDRNLADIPPGDIHRTQVLMTMMDGRVLHDFRFGWGDSKDAPSFQFQTGFAGIQCHQHGDAHDHGDD